MKKIKLIVLALFAFNLFFISSCEQEEDTTVYWPESLAYNTGSGWKTRIGDWIKEGGQMLTFHNSPSNQWAKLSVKAAGGEQEDSIDYFLVSYIEGESFIIRKGNESHTVKYELENDILTIIDNGGSVITEDEYTKIQSVP